MTKKEKEAVIKAINRLCDDDGWQDGIDILKKLVNKDYENPFVGMKKVKLTDICTVNK